MHPTCYGDVTKELRSLCKYEDINMINEAFFVEGQYYESA
jgi:hypothetical protein